jgi:hypothetical protein
MSAPEPLSEGQVNAAETVTRDAAAQKETFVDPGETNAEFWAEWRANRRQRRRHRAIERGDEPDEPAESVHTGPWPPSLQTGDDPAIVPDNSVRVGAERVNADEHQDYWNRWAAMNAQIEASLRRDRQASGPSSGSAGTTATDTPSQEAKPGKTAARQRGSKPAVDQPGEPIQPAVATPTEEDRNDARRPRGVTVEVRLTDDGERMVVGGNIDQDYWQNWASGRRAERKAARAEEAARDEETRRQTIRMLQIATILVVVLTACVVLVARLLLVPAQTTQDDSTQTNVSRHVAPGLGRTPPVTGVR